MTKDQTHRLSRAARLLAVSLTDEMLVTLRIEWGNTTAMTMARWRDEILDVIIEEGAKNAN